MRGCEMHHFHVHSEPQFTLSVMKGSSTANMLSKVPLSNIIIRTRTDYISEDKVYIFLQN